MKAGGWDRSTMRGSAKAFGSRALKRSSRRQQFVWRKLEVLVLPKSSGGEVEIMRSHEKAVAVQAVVRFIKS